MINPFRLGLPLLGALVLSALWPAQAPAQNYPSRPITMIVPFAVGGLTDVPARVLAAMLQERIGQNIVVENKPGGSGTLGGSYAVRAAPDGYTLFANSIADAQNLYFLPMPYNAIDDFAMIGMIVEGPPLVLIVDAALPYKIARRIARRRQSQSEQDQLRHVRAGDVAGDGDGATQCTRQDRNRRRALQRLRRGRAQRDGKRRARRVRVLCPGQAAGGQRQSARAGDRKPAADRDLARSADHAGAGIPQFRLSRLRRPRRARQDAGADHRLSSTKR